MKASSRYRSDQPRCLVIPRTGLLCFFVLLSMLVLSSPSAAQGAAPLWSPQEVLQHKFANRSRGSGLITPVHHVLADRQWATPGQKQQGEIVFHNFVSPPNGAYPSTGVIRDSAGNLYGTTNGSYSDVGGGGTNNDGLVYKIDKSGNQTVLYSFTGGADGSSPNGLVLDTTGNLYGTAYYSGAFGAGVVFEVGTSGNETVLYTFTGGSDGGNPYSVIRDASGNLYGVTEGGGDGYGVVFKLDTSGNQSVLYTFTGGSDGAYPNNIILAGGSIYGTTTYGGAFGAGVVFELGMSGHETVLYTFTGGSDGGASDAGVVRDPAGNFYGTTSGGGDFGAGVVFKLDTSGNETVLYSFTGGADGAYPQAGLARDFFGNFYGTTAFGGANGLGVVFKLDKSGNQSVLHTFKRGPYGNQPDFAGVILDPEGNLYGTTAFNGADGQGAVYKLDPKGKATLVYAFAGATDGQYPYNTGVTFGAGGQIYGTGSYGGRGGAGIVYQLDAQGDETVLFTFDCHTFIGYCQPTGNLLQDSKGNLYGTTFIGQASVGYGYGVVYKLNTSGHATVLHNFTGGADGADPYGGVIRDSKSNLYGTAQGGGTFGAGVVFELDKSGAETVLYNFTGGNDGGYPIAGLIRDSAGNFYGTTNGGGAFGAGVVFEIDTSGNETVLYTFTGGNDGGSPYGSVTRDSNGNLYGTTSGGGAFGAGVVFKIDTSGNETPLYTFTGGTDGAVPLWVGLVFDSSGNLYGTTAGGGNSNAGVVFKLDPLGNETVLYSFTGGTDGNSPYVGVTFGPDGNLYGTTIAGGESNAGVVFEIQLE